MDAKEHAAEYSITATFVMTLSRCPDADRALD
jgi:hypothetical protein